MQFFSHFIPLACEGWPSEESEIFLLSLVWEDVREDIQIQEFEGIKPPVERVPVVPVRPTEVIGDR